MTRIRLQLFFLGIQAFLLIIHPNIAYSVPKKTLQQCLQAADFKGCVEANSTIQKEKITSGPFSSENCPGGQGFLGITVFPTDLGYAVITVNPNSALKEGDEIMHKKIPKGCLNEVITLTIEREGAVKSQEVRYSKSLSSMKSLMALSGPLAREYAINYVNTGNPNDPYTDYAKFLLMATDKNTNAQCFKVINNEKLAEIVAREYDDHFAQKYGKTFIQFCQNHWQTHQIKFDGTRYIRGVWPFIFNNSITKNIPITIDCKDKTFDADGDKKKWRSFNTKDGKKGDFEEVCRSFNL